MSSNKGKQKRNDGRASDQIFQIDHRNASYVCNCRTLEQKMAGDCWALNLMLYVEMLIAKQVGKCPQLSYQEMIDCFTPPIKSSFVNFYNEGASLVDASYFLRERGVLLEKYYPNEGIRPFNEIIRKRRDLDIPESAWTKPIKDFHLFVPETHDLNDPKVIQQICKALDEKPILMGFAIGDDFDESMTNSWRIYAPRDDSETRYAHCMIVVGYYIDLKNPKKNYWIVLNPYGRQWGKNGFGRLLMCSEKNPIKAAIVFDIDKDWKPPDEWIPYLF